MANCVTFDRSSSVLWSSPYRPNSSRPRTFATTRPSAKVLPWLKIEAMMFQTRPLCSRVRNAESRRVESNTSNTRRATAMRSVDEFTEPHFQEQQRPQARAPVARFPPVLVDHAAHELALEQVAPRGAVVEQH